MLAFVMFPSEYTFLCTLSFVNDFNIFAHIVQSYDLLSVCKVAKWTFKLFFCENVCWQMLHWCRFPPMWFLLCSVHPVFEANMFLQSKHMKSFRLLWALLCSSNSLSSLKDLIQNLHQNLLIPTYPFLRLSERLIV